MIIVGSCLASYRITYTTSTFVVIVFITVTSLTTLIKETFVRN